MPHFMAHFGNYSRHGHKKKLKSRNLKQNSNRLGQLCRLQLKGKSPGCKLVAKQHDHLQKTAKKK